MLRASKFGWLRCCQEMRSTLVTQTMAKLNWDDTCENIRLIQACIYHGCYKILSKEQSITAIHHNLPF